MLSVIRRFYVNNFRCLENFDLSIGGRSSVLLIGKNGTGKTTVGFALEMLQKIARDKNRVRELVGAKDFAQGRAQQPMRFEIEVELQGHLYGYTIAFEFPEGFRELRVFEERLTVDGTPIYTREAAQVHLFGKIGKTVEAHFPVDWHLVALPIVQQQSTNDPLFIFKRWLARMLILRPIPSQILGDSKDETLQPSTSVTDFGAWFSGLIADTPAAYAKIDGYLKQVMPDLKDIRNPVVGKDSKSLEIHFANDQASLILPFEDLSDGEKCFMICALVLAANQAYGPLFCFWDEPDNYLALSEVGHFIVALNSAFNAGGQLIATSHHEESIRHFAKDNILHLSRRSHLEPTIVRPVKDIPFSGDLVGALIRDDVEP